MALSDLLPDRPLTLDEFQDLQAQDAFDELYTSDGFGDIDLIIGVKGDMEYMIHYNEKKGWHLGSKNPRN